MLKRTAYDARYNSCLCTVEVLCIPVLPNIKAVREEDGVASRSSYSLHMLNKVFAWRDEGWHAVHILAEHGMEAHDLFLH